MNEYSSDDLKARVSFLKKITQNYTLATSPTDEHCDDYLNRLEATMTSDNFFWVVNLGKQKVERSSGIYIALGYPDNLTREAVSLTLFDIYKIVHKDMQASSKAKREIAALYINEKLKGKIKPLSEDFVYKVIVCFTKKNGEHILVKQRSTAFQVDKHGNMLSYLSWHTIIRDYNKEAPSLEIIINGKREIELEKEVIKESSELINSPFTDRQRTILKVLADYAEEHGIEEGTPNSVTLSKVLKKKTGIELAPNTIETHLSRAKTNSAKHYDLHFKRPVDLAIYLRKYHLI